MKNLYESIKNVVSDLEEAAPKAVNEITVKSMDQGKALKVYEKLKKGSRVIVDFGNAMSVNNKPRELVVTSPHRIVGKSKVGRIILNHPDEKGVKYKLYNRDGKISLAQGDMGTILKDLKIMKESVNEKMDPTEHVVEKDGKFAVVNLKGKTMKTFDDKKEADAYAIKFHDKIMGRVDEILEPMTTMAIMGMGAYAGAQAGKYTGMVSHDRAVRKGKFGKDAQKRQLEYDREAKKNRGKKVNKIKSAIKGFVSRKRK